MDKTEKFLDSQTLKISNYKSPRKDIVKITNAELGAELALNKGFIEYVTGSILPNVNSQENYNDAYRTYMNKQEAAAILSAAKINLSRIDPRAFNKIRGHNIVFRDDNPFLAGDNQYGKLIMEIVNSGKIQYNNKDDALFDIYIAGTALQALYLQHIGSGSSSYLNNDIFRECLSYYDVYNAVITTDPTITLDVMTKDNFIAAYNARTRGKWAWITEEYEHSDSNVGFFERIYKSVERDLQVKVLNETLINNFKTFVRQVIEKCPPAYRDLYTAEMQVMFASTSLILLQEATKYHSIKSGNTYVFTKTGGTATDKLIAEIVRIDFVPVKININKESTINFYRDSGGDMEFVSFNSSIGSDAYVKLINELGFMATSVQYSNLLDEYGNAMRGHFRNMFAGIILAAISPLKTRREFKDKQIVFNDPALFFGADYNFVGKAIEISVNNNEMLNTSPQFSPMFSPITHGEFVIPSEWDNTPISPGDLSYDPHSPAYDPHSPGDLSYDPYSPAYDPHSPPQSPTTFFQQPAPPKNVLIRLGYSDKFERSANVDYIHNSAFTIDPPASMDGRIASWVLARFNEFIGLYTYIYNHFLSPADFDLEVFYRYMYEPYINKFINTESAASINSIADQFKPNNTVSRLFVYLIVSNFSVMLDDRGAIDIEKFLLFQEMGRSTLSEDFDIDGKIADYKKYMNIHIAKYFKNTDIDYIRSAGFFINENSPRYTEREILSINFWLWWKDVV